MTPTRAVILVPSDNTPGKRDVTGAFAPEAKRFARLLRSGGCDVTETVVDNRKPMKARRTATLEAIDGASQSGPIDCIAFFCHGWRDGVQHGFTRRTAKDLAALAVTNDVLIALYCCSTGEDAAKRSIGAPGVGDGSFADRLRDDLCASGHVDCRVVSHTTVAHTTRNPHVVFFEGLGSTVGGVGGIAPVSPRHPLWRPWKAKLRTDRDFRFRFPMMSIGEIHAELGA